MAPPMPHPASATFPETPALVRVWRGGHVESQHRGSWVLVDAAGEVLDSAGAIDWPFHARSSIKCLQALPLVETGAADRYALTPSELALAVSSHNAEPVHTDGVRAVLARLGLGVDDLQCGPQPPGDVEARRALESAGAAPSALHNNCSGKHAGFLALARHLDADTRAYLAPDAPVQRHVRSAVGELTGHPPEDLSFAIDGCSAPTWRLTLTEIATAFARVTSPAGLAPERRAACERIVSAVAAHPVHLAGSRGRLCTALVRASGGALFPKVGAEAVYAVGAVGRSRALAVKIDDGGSRALHAVVLRLLARFGLLDERAAGELTSWSDPELVNWAGREVGRIEVVD